MSTPKLRISDNVNTLVSRSKPLSLFVLTSIYYYYNKDWGIINKDRCNKNNTAIDNEDGLVIAVYKIPNDIKTNYNYLCIKTNIYKAITNIFFR